MNFWIFLIGYGVIQSLLLIYLLSSAKSKRSKGNKYLIALLIATTYIGIHFMLINLGYRQLHPNLFVLGFSPLFLMPPLYFLFCANSLNLIKLSLKTMLHFIPFLLFLGIQFLETKFIFKKYIFFAFVIQLLTYSVLSYRIINVKKENTIEIKPGRAIIFLTNVMLIFASSVLLLYVITTVFKVNSINLINVVIVFLIVFVTILEINMIKEPKNGFDFTVLKKYKNSNLQPNKINDLEEKLNQLLVNDKVFLDSNLKANTLANMLKISRHELSEFINQELECSFNELINKHRVNYIKQDLLNKQKSNISISGLAQEAGFNSDATFYRAFKIYTGFTPSEYIKLNS